MAKTIFSKPAHVEIDGVQALQLMEKRREVTTYSLLGFSAPVIVQDFRPKSHQRPTNSLNAPALVTLRNQHEEGLLVQLHPTSTTDPRHMLWIAVGLDEFLPRYDCVFDLFDFADDNTLAFLALYKRPRRKELKEDYSFLSV